MRLFARIFATIALTGAAASAVLLPGVVAAQDVQKTSTPRAKHHETPKAELFLGYSRFGTVRDDATCCNRIVGLNGGSASIAFNFNRYLGVLGDFGGYGDSRLELAGTGVNQPLTVNSSGTAYTYLFGPRFSYRNRTRLTPFVQILAGGVHASAVNVDNCAGTGCALLPAQDSLALTAGGGLDIRLTHHLSIRAVQAEYMLTRFDGVVNGVSTGSSAVQNDLRLSAGLVFGFGGRQPSPPVQVACSVQPATVFPGDPVMASATGSNLSPKRKAVYRWTATGGVVSGTESTANLSTAGLAPGTYTVSAHVAQGDSLDEQAGCTSEFTVRPFDAPTIVCSAAPSSLMPGDTATITAQAASPQNRPLSYSYTASSGAISGTGSTASLNTRGVVPGTITVSCNVVDDMGKTAAATTSVSVNAAALTAAPQPTRLCSISFDRDRKRPTRVDNEAKACLDEIALKMQRELDGKLVIEGSYAEGETAKTALERAANASQYLVKEKGVDASRIEPRAGSASGRTATNTFVPAGAAY